MLAAFIACAALLFAASGAAASGAGEQAAGHLAERQLAQQADGLLGAEQLVDTADVERRGAGKHGVKYMSGAVWWVRGP